jgi:hypothetical protein
VYHLFLGVCDNDDAGNENATQLLSSFELSREKRGLTVPAVFWRLHYLRSVGNTKTVRDSHRKETAIMKTQFLCAASVIVLAVAGCAKDSSDENKRDLTQREKDSILGASQIPGAKAVNRAMTSADSATARALRLDSAQKEP